MPDAFIRRILQNPLEKFTEYTITDPEKIYEQLKSIKKLGYSEDHMTIRAWAALVAPKDTPKEKLQALRDAAKQVCDSKEFKDYFISQGIDPVAIIGEDCNKMMKDDDAMFAEFLKDIK